MLGSIAASGISYPDRRDEFVRVLWCKGRSMGHNIRTDQKQARVSLMRAATSIALHSRPLRTCQSAQLVDGVGTKWVSVLKANEEKSDKNKSKWPHAPPASGTFASPAVAVLVAMLEFTER